MTNVVLTDFPDEIEKALITCPVCGVELLMLEHSEFEDGYYLYCDRCPRRVDISIYDEPYEKIEKQLQSRIKDFDDRDDALDILLSEIEPYLHACECGGKFRNGSPKRCLNCGEKLAGYESHMNVWYLRHFDDECEDEELSKYIIKPKWCQSD